MPVGELREPAHRQARATETGGCWVRTLIRSGTAGSERPDRAPHTNIRRWEILRHRVTTILVLMLLIAAASAPAGAQAPLTHTFSLRYWGSQFYFGNPSPAVSQYGQPGWGLSYRGDMVDTPWSFSASYDRLFAGGQFWETASLFNANVHYRFGNIPNARASVFAGYGRIGLSDQVGGQGGTGSGARLGADFFAYLQPQQLTGWYATGEFAWGPSWASNFAAFPGLANGTTSEYKVALGHEFGQGMAAQVGWRSFNWNIPTSPGCSSPGCQFRWSGWTLEFLMRR